MKELKKELKKEMIKDLLEFKGSISLSKLLEIEEFLKKNEISKKHSDLIRNFPLLKTSQRFALLRDYLKNREDFEYIYVQGVKFFESRFVYIGNKNSPKALAIKYFFATPKGKIINFNCPDSELKRIINIYISKIFEGCVIKQQHDNLLKFPLKRRY